MIVSAIRTMPKVFGEIANAGWQQEIANRKAAVDFWPPNGGIILFSYRHYGKVSKPRTDS
jgi:hypothetical protein